MTYIAASGHKMIATTTHDGPDGLPAWDFWNAQHSATCPCLTSEDW